mmetsp:Transcript_9762/g.27551  ORF Transcript_9762/g.27551 Transcript_9762/m.27551 type:complete len:576 (+) Transcript_9762:299-2026(+)
MHSLLLCLEVLETPLINRNVLVHTVVRVNASVAERACRRERLEKVPPKWHVPQGRHVALLAVVGGQMVEGVDGRHLQLLRLPTHFAAAPLDPGLKPDGLRDAPELQQELRSLLPHGDNLLRGGTLVVLALHLPCSPRHGRGRHLAEAQPDVVLPAGTGGKVGGRHLGDERGQLLQHLPTLLHDELLVVRLGKGGLKPELVLAQEGHAVPLQAVLVKGRRLRPALVAGAGRRRGLLELPLGLLHLAGQEGLLAALHALLLHHPDLQIAGADERRHVGATADHEAAQHDDGRRRVVEEVPLVREDDLHAEHPRQDAARAEGVHEVELLGEAHLVHRPLVRRKRLVVGSLAALPGLPADLEAVHAILQVVRHMPPMEELHSVDGEDVGYKLERKLHCVEKNIVTSMLDPDPVRVQDLGLLVEPRTECEEQGRQEVAHSIGGQPHTEGDHVLRVALGYRCPMLGLSGSCQGRVGMGVKLVARGLVLLQLPRRLPPQAPEPLQVPQAGADHSQDLADDEVLHGAHVHSVDHLDAGDDDVRRQEVEQGLCREQRDHVRHLAHGVDRDHQHRLAHAVRDCQP